MNNIFQFTVGGAVSTILPVASVILAAGLSASPPYKFHGKLAFKCGAALCLFSGALGCFFDPFWFVGSIVGVIAAYAICKIKLNIDPFAK